MNLQDERLRLIIEWRRGKLTDEEFNKQLNEIDRLIGSLEIKKEMQEVHE